MNDDERITGWPLVAIYAGIFGVGIAFWYGVIQLIGWAL